MEFAGFRRIANYGWIRAIGEQEFLEDVDWDYYDSDEEDGCIIAFNLVTKEFAWIRSDD